MRDTNQVRDLQARLHFSEQLFVDFGPLSLALDAGQVEGSREDRESGKQGLHKLLNVLPLPTETVVDGPIFEQGNITEGGQASLLETATQPRVPQKPGQRR
eukprot:8397180-Alexandrium_andersonii.AAC.1